MMVGRSEVLADAAFPAYWYLPSNKDRTDDEDDRTLELLPMVIQSSSYEHIQLRLALQFLLLTETYSKNT